jgi:DNA-binding NtrC family response regulator
VFLERLPFAWPGNARHIEQLAARLTMEGARGPVSADHLSRLLGERARGDAPGGELPVGASLDQGLPRLLEETEKAWLIEALRRYSDLTRAELAAKLRISESALYKKLREYGLGS